MRPAPLAEAVRRRAMTMVLGGLCAVASAGAGVAQAPSVGSGIGNPAVLARFFTAACFQSTSLSQAQATLANAGLVLNPETGTYFHQQLDMSVNPSGALCSIVFAGTEDAADRIAFRRSAEQVIGALVNDVEIIRIDEVDDLYLRASVEVRW